MSVGAEQIRRQLLKVGQSPTYNPLARMIMRGISPDCIRATLIRQT